MLRKFETSLKTGAQIVFTALVLRVQEASEEVTDLESVLSLVMGRPTLRLLPVWYRDVVASDASITDSCSVELMLRDGR